MNRRRRRGAGGSGALIRTTASVLCALALLASVPLRAQEDTTRDEFWPEVDAYVKLTDRTRLFFLGTVARNREVDFAEGMVGAHLDVFLAPLGRPWLRHTPDVQKRRYLTFRAGYRYAWDLDDREEYEEHRILFEATARFPPIGRFLAINRNRLDLRDVNGEWSWRYRNRTRLEREIALGTRAVTPYLMAEFFYDSRYDAWNRQRYFAGIEWPLGGGGILDTYYCRQNDSHSSVAHVNAFGLALNVFF